ncbi:hypothetical protein ROLI_020160 [Roseobacter fucihabitans]|uniref:Imelysin-like domain-containing protein n=1 Tax=Roseobacter fucihabitans TaxID=1537242 RepID=A0ABZ2BSK1_9RHOB|nr:imelysin family protein [Roseobacter litoralis]MBC6966568.1 Imelysin [Roseobacter litoralis]
MRILATLALAITASSPALADIEQAVEDQILPGYARFAEAGETLANAARMDCAPQQLLPAYYAAYDAWISISHIQFGPLEARHFNLAIAFWPDPKDRVGKALSRLKADKDVTLSDPGVFREVSVAAQGFSALERLLSAPQEDADYACALTRAITTHLADVARILHEDWTGGFGEGFVAGKTEVYKTKQEAQRALYTSLSTGLEFLHDQRLARPLGTFDRPRPMRAEARRSERSLRHVSLSLIALRALAETGFDATMSDDLRRAFDTAIAQAKGLDDPAMSGVGDPVKRFKIEVLQRMVRDVQAGVAQDIGAPLGISAGFNALDGD